MNIQFGDNSQSSLSTNKKILDVVSCVILVDLGLHVQDGSVRKNSFHSQNVGSERAIPHHVNTSCISRGISSQLARSLGSKI